MASENVREKEKKTWKQEIIKAKEKWRTGITVSSNSRYFPRNSRITLANSQEVTVMVLLLHCNNSATFYVPV